MPSWSQTNIFKLILLNTIHFAIQFNVTIKQLTYHSDYSEFFIHSTRPLLKCSFTLRITIKKPLNLPQKRLVETKSYIENTIKVQLNATNYSILATVITICNQCEGFHKII